LGSSTWISVSLETPGVRIFIAIDRAVSILKFRDSYSKVEKQSVIDLKKMGEATQNCCNRCRLT
jgi:hypothetical protein